jgi:hypothetical protein
MRYRILDQNGDYSFGRGQQNITYGKYAVSQAIKTRLKQLKGEWWEDKEDGLPLFEQILGKPGINGNVTIIDSLIKERIVETIDVISIQEFTNDYNSANRSYSFNCTVNTKYGTISVSDNL